jgi:hypothetical protein
MARRAPPVDEQTLRRALKYCALPHGRIKTACERYGVTEGALRRARKELGPARLTLEDLVLNGLSAETPTRPLDLKSYLDWLDHAVYSEEEILGLLRSLVRQGLVAERPDGFVLIADWP